MATAESVKAKIESLIAGANSMTNRNDTTLWDAVMRLIEGYNATGELNAGTMLYGASSDAGLSGGDFVELIPSWGSGNVIDKEIGALAVAQLSDSKAVVVYTPTVTGLSTDIYAVLLSADGPSVTTTEPLRIELAKKNAPIAAVALSDSKVLVTYQYGDALMAGGPATYSGRAIVLTAGDTLTAGAIVSFYNNIVNEVSVTALTDSKALVVYRDSNSNGRVAMLKVEGTALRVVYASPIESSFKNPKVTKMTDSTALLVYETYDNTAGKAVVLSCSDLIVTLGSVYTFRSANTSDLALTPLDSRRALLVYRDAGSTGYLTATVLQVSGTSVTTQNSPSLTFTSYGGTKPAVARVNDQAVLVLANILTASSGYKTQAQLLTIGDAGITKAAEIDLTGPANQDGLHALAVKSDGTALALSGNVDSGSTKLTRWQGLDIEGTAVSCQQTQGTRVVPLTSEKYPVGVVKSVGGSSAYVFVYRAGTRY